jgi:predicted RNA binding protein with dsRBD fold (UPF0201 family)
MSGEIRQVPNSAPGNDAYRELAQTANRQAQITQPFHVLTITADKTLDRVYGVILVNAIVSAITVTLPMAGAYNGVRFHVKKIDATANTVTIDGNGSETIDGSATAVITITNVCLTVLSDGTQWWIV